jgi:serine O-acetyltransferase
MPLTLCKLRAVKRLVSPEGLWHLSRAAHQRGRQRTAKLLKILIYFAYRAVLPYEVDVAPDVRLLHRGLGVVVHPRTVIGSGVMIGHGVTIAAGSADDRNSRVVIEDSVLVGANSSIAAPMGRATTIGARSAIGIGCVVTKDVPPDTRVRAPEPSYKPGWSG